MNQRLNRKRKMTSKREELGRWTPRILLVRPKTAQPTVISKTLDLHLHHNLIQIEIIQFFLKFITLSILN